MKATVLNRSFTYNGVSLADPGMNFSPAQVQQFFSAAYPELTSAVIEGPIESNGNLEYSFKKSVGTKA